MLGFAAKKVVVEGPPSYATAITDAVLPAATAHAHAFLVHVVAHRVHLLGVLCLLLALPVLRRLVAAEVRLHRRTSPADHGPAAPAEKQRADDDVTAHTLALTPASSASGASRDSDGSISSVEPGAGDGRDGDGRDDPAVEETYVEETYDEFLTKLGFEEQVPPVAPAAEAEDAPTFDHIDLAGSESEDCSLMTFGDKVYEDAPAARDVAASAERVLEDAPATQDAAVLDTASSFDQIFQDDAALEEEEAPATQDAAALETASSFDQVFQDDAAPEEEEAPTIQDAAAVEEQVLEDALTTQDAAVSDTASFDQVSDTSTTSRPDERDTVVPAQPSSAAPTAEGAVASSKRRASVKKQLSTRIKPMKRSLSKIFKQ